MEDTRYMIKKLFITSLSFGLLFFCHCVSASTTLWSIQSIDTMKTSRDLTLMQMNNPQFDDLINKELLLIKETGANFVTIDTGYDSQFVPWMKRWVRAARKLNLHVWFRGNFSSWEGWFEYPKNMTRKEHIQSTKSFIVNNPDLFEDGDIFTACPECEYGGPGNPLESKNYEGFRQFLIEEITAEKQAFAQINKKVSVSLQSMNPDVAKQIVNTDFLKATDNIITLDYYIKNIGDLDTGLNFFSKKFPGVKLVIGEFGAPLPAINGAMDEAQQARFVNNIFAYLYKRNDVIGINYWVSSGGEIALLNSNLTKRKVFSTVKNYFSPGIVELSVANELGDILEGNSLIPIPANTTTELFASANDYFPQYFQINLTSNDVVKQRIVLEPVSPNILFRLRMWLRRIGK